MHTLQHINVLTDGCICVPHWLPPRFSYFTHTHTHSRTHTVNTNHGVCFGNVLPQQVRVVGIAVVLNMLCVRPASVVLCRWGPRLCENAVPRVLCPQAHSERKPLGQRRSESVGSQKIT
jgi:hypothetical protein